MKIGDKVRFLSESGGGKISGFKGKNIVLVEDEDGFEIPTPINEVVVIEQDDYTTRHLVAAKIDTKTKADAHAQTELAHDHRSVKAMMQDNMDNIDNDGTDDFDVDPADKEVTFRQPARERDGGNKLSAFLAFVPLDAKQLTVTDFEEYIVNDSNYYLRYTYLEAEGNAYRLVFEGEVEPNTKVFLRTIKQQEITLLGKIAIQMLSYKREGKTFLLKPAVDVQLRLDPMRFFKLHVMEKNDFFDQPALIYTLVENDAQQSFSTEPVSSKKEKQKAKTDDSLQKDLLDKFRKDHPAADYKGSAKVNKITLGSRNAKENRPLPYRDDRLESGTEQKREVKREVPNPLVVDLHAKELLDTTAGMNAGDILHYQVDYFKSVMEEYKKSRGQKIVFIHGKGEGVLRQAILHELNYRYKTCTYQDASFREYGYGATQVTIK